MYMESGKVKEEPRNEVAIRQAHKCPLWQCALPGKRKWDFIGG
jgi:hypothetical protein